MRFKSWVPVLTGRSAVELSLLLVIVATTAAAAGTIIERNRPSYLPARIRPGTELVMIFIASSSCRGINGSEIEKAINDLRNAYRQHAAKANANLRDIWKAINGR
jgi:hypothetical protein